MSSGEAERGGVVKGASEVWIKSIGRGLGVGPSCAFHKEMPLARGTCNRIRVGKVRHLAVSQLWRQERLLGHVCTLFKCRANPSRRTS